MLSQNIPKLHQKIFCTLQNQDLSQSMSSWKSSINFALSIVSLWQLGIHLNILTHFVKSRSPGIFADSIVSIWHFGKSKYLDHHVLHTQEISMEAFQIWKGFVITKSVFLQSKSDAQLKRIFCPLDQTNTYGPVIWLVYSSFPFKAFFCLFVLWPWSW